jgi:putative spermidine/putrescine transport system substrate-binding protein
MMTSTKRAILVAAAAALVLAAAPALAQDNSVSGTVTLAGYSGLFHEKYAKAVVEPFMAKYPNVKVNYYEQQNSAQILGTLRAQKGSPQIDAAILDISVAKIATDEGLFAAFDDNAIPNAKDLYEMAVVPGVNARGFTFDNLALLYNTKAVTTRPDSWSALADPKQAGKVVISGIPDIQGIALLLIMDKLAGGNGLAGGLAKGLEHVVEIAPSVQTFEPKPDAYPLIINGTATIGIGWNARAQTFHDSSGGALGVVLPKEGSVFQVNGIGITEGSPNAKAAQLFVNYALSPEAQKAFTEAMFYAPTNRKAEISEEALQRTAAGAMDRMIPVDWTAVAKSRDKLTEQWRRQVLPASR